MVSGYRSPIYDATLATWRRVDFRAMTRGGPAIESMWCNFQASAERHDYSYLGADFRERERIKRKQARWCRRIATMQALEREALYEALIEHRHGRRGEQLDAGQDPASPNPTIGAGEAGPRSRIAGPGGNGRAGDAVPGCRIIAPGDDAGSQASGPEEGGP